MWRRYRREDLTSQSAVIARPTGIERLRNFRRCQTCLAAAIARESPETIEEIDWSLIEDMRNSRVFAMYDESLEALWADERALRDEVGLAPAQVIEAAKTTPGDTVRIVARGSPAHEAAKKRHASRVPRSASSPSAGCCRSQTASIWSRRHPVVTPGRCVG